MSRSIDTVIGVIGVLGLIAFVVLSVWEKFA